MSDLLHQDQRGVSPLVFSLDTSFDVYLISCFISLTFCPRWQRICEDLTLDISTAVYAQGITLLNNLYDSLHQKEVLIKLIIKQIVLFGMYYKIPALL